MRCDLLLTSQEGARLGYTCPEKRCSIFSYSYQHPANEGHSVPQTSDLSCAKYHVWPLTCICLVAERQSELSTCSVPVSDPHQVSSGRPEL